MCNNISFLCIIELRLSFLSFQSFFWYSKSLMLPDANWSSPDFISTTAWLKVFFFNLCFGCFELQAQVAYEGICATLVPHLISWVTQVQLCIENKKQRLLCMHVTAIPQSNYYIKRTIQALLLFLFVLFLWINQYKLHALFCLVWLYHSMFGEGMSVNNVYVVSLVCVLLYNIQNTCIVQSSFITCIFSLFIIFDIYLKCIKHSLIKVFFPSRERTSGAPF